MPPSQIPWTSIWTTYRQCQKLLPKHFLKGLVLGISSVAMVSHYTPLKGPKALSHPRASGAAATLVTGRVSHKARIHEKIKEPKSSSKVGFGGMVKVGQKVGPKVGFPVEEKRKTYFRTYFLTYFDHSPETYFSATFGLLYFFRGFLALWLTRPVTKLHLQVSRYTVQLCMSANTIRPEMITSKFLSKFCFGNCFVILTKIWRSHISRNIRSMSWKFSEITCW